MRASRLKIALKTLEEAMHEVGAALKEMQSEHDPLAAHIFVSRRQYRETKDTKGGRRHEMAARLSYENACDLGFRGGLDDWKSLLGAATSR